MLKCLILFAENIQMFYINRIIKSKKYTRSLMTTRQNDRFTVCYFESVVQ